MMEKLRALFAQYNQQSLEADKLENTKFTAKSDDSDFPCSGCCNCLQGFANCMSDL